MPDATSIGANELVSQAVGGTTTRYRWDVGWNVLNEEDNLGALTRTYVGRSAAHVDGSDPSTGTWRFYVHDHLGSTRGVYNSDKTPYAGLEHTPYGELYASSGSISSITRRYTGHDWDAAAGLYYAPYRYYSPRLARWISRDPLGMVDGPNVYEYVQSTPVQNVDLLGSSIIKKIADWFLARRECNKAIEVADQCAMDNCPKSETCGPEDPDYVDKVLDERATTSGEDSNPYFACLKKHCATKIDDVIEKCSGIKELPNFPVPTR